MTTNENQKQKQQQKRIKEQWFAYQMNNVAYFGVVYDLELPGTRERVVVQVLLQQQDMLIIKKEQN